MSTASTLSARGSGVAKGPSVRDKFGKILSNPYARDSNPDGFVNLGTAENYAMVPAMRRFINDSRLQFSDIDFTYGEGPWGTKRLREAMAKQMARIFQAIEPIDPEDLIFANGVTSLCEMLAFTMFDPGDGVLLPRPIYQAFPVDFGLKGKVESVYIDFDGVDQFSPAAVDKFEEAVVKSEANGVRVRAIMLCNPHNPLGKCYPKQTIIGLMKLCDKRKIHLLCDEIYAASVYDVPDESALPFTSVLSFDYSPYISSDYVHVYYGMSKDFAAGGLRLGCMYIKNKELMRGMSAMNQFHWPSLPSQEIATWILTNDDWLEAFLQLSRDRLAAGNRLARKLLQDMGIGFAPGSNAGFFLWIDLRPFLPQGTHFPDDWAREDALKDTFVDHGVYLTNGSSLKADEAGWFRLIFSQEEDVIVEGLSRVARIIGVPEPHR